MMPERVEAHLVDWDDSRGFGFARLPGGTERVFVHIKSINPTMPRPRAGDHLELEVVPGRNGKPAARSVNIIGPETGIEAPLSLHLATAAMLMILLQVGIMLDRVPLWFATIYVLMGGISMVAYSWDKRAAQVGVWRISENTLLSIDLFGGVIGGLLAQHMFRHKRHKPSFQTMILVVVLIHSAIFAGLGSGLLVLPGAGPIV